MDGIAPDPVTDLVVIPTTGEVVNPSEPRAVAAAIREIESLERDLTRAKTELRAALVGYALREGTKTLRWGKLTAVVTGGATTVYDAEAIERDLLEAGMSPERVSQIVTETVTVSRKVKASEAKRAAGINPAYAAIIARHSTTVESTPGVRVT